MDAKRVTLKDIAAETGLSVNSVSLALRGIRVSEETRQRVRLAAEKLGYVGNAQASSIRTGVTHSIAVIVGDVANPHTARVIKECVHLFSAEQYSVIIMGSEEDEELEKRSIRSALRQNVDGVLISPVKKDGENLNLLAESGVPTVVFGSKCKNKLLSSVCMDDEQAGFLAAEHLIRRGFRRVLMLNGPLEVQGAQERMNGYLRALRQYGLQANADDVIFADLKDERSWHEPLRRRLQMLSEPAALLVYSDMLALLAYSYCADHDIGIGAVAGFDNALRMLPQALRFPSAAEKDEKIAVTAPKLLLNMLKDSTCGIRKIVLPASLYNT